MWILIGVNINFVVIFFFLEKLRLFQLEKNKNNTSFLLAILLIILLYVVFWFHTRPVIEWKFSFTKEARVQNYNKREEQNT